MKAEWSKISLIFFFLVALKGTLLRLAAFIPIFFEYQSLIHAHSHTAFQGWVYLAMFPLLINAFLTEEQIEKGKYLLQFKLTIFIVFGVLISFALQGYGLYSIIFSTLFQLLNYGFIFSFLRDTKKNATTTSNLLSIRFIKTGLWYGLISTIFPYCIGVLSAKGLNGTEAYHSFVYAFLHLQNNGWFLFVVLGLFFNLFERKNIPYNYRFGTVFYWLIHIITIPSITLSLVGMKYSAPLLPIAYLAAATMGIALIYFILAIQGHLIPLIRKESAWFKLFFFAFLLSFLLKTALQCLSVFSQFENYAFFNRPIILAYLHLSLIGSTSFLFLALLIERKWLALNERTKMGSILLLIGFVTTELLLVFAGLDLFHSQILLIIGSAAMALGVLSLIISGSVKNKQHAST